MESQLLTAYFHLKVAPSFCPPITAPPLSDWPAVTLFTWPLRWVEAAVLTWGCLLIEQGFHLSVCMPCFQRQRDLSWEGGLGDILWVLKCWDFRICRWFMRTECQNIWSLGFYCQWLSNPLALWKPCPPSPLLPNAYLMRLLFILESLSYQQCVY